MNLQNTRYLTIFGSVILMVLGANISQAGSPDLTLPFNDPDVYLRQGWLYDSPGPFICPENQGGDRCHKGIDYFKGTPGAWESFDILATANGWAVASQDTNYGLFILIAHDQTDSNGARYFTLYAHLASKEEIIPLIQKNNMRDNASTDNFASWVRVSRGKRIGVAGSDGATTNVIHLHLEVQRGGYALNKTDPYDIYSDYSDYSNNCGSNYLWMQCPPEPPPTIAALQVSFDPNPAPQSSMSCLGVSPAWEYLATVSETAGVGVTINNIQWDYFDSGGNYLNTQTMSGADFAAFFNACGPESSYISPGYSACGYLCTNLGGLDSGSVVTTFTGQDDNGNTVTGSGQEVMQSSLIPLMQTIDVKGPTSVSEPSSGKWGE